MQTNPTYYKPETPTEWYDRICRNQQARIKQSQNMDEYHERRQVHNLFKAVWRYMNILAEESI